MADTKYIPASKVYAEYSLPRNLLRSLSDEGEIECIVKETCGKNVLKLYRVADIQKYLNGK